MVTIRNAEENQWLVDNFDSFKNYWIGLTDNKSEGKWQWVSGEKVSYLDWAPNQPDNETSYNSKGENYAHFNVNICCAGTAGQWNDMAEFWPTVENSITKLGIVEKTAPKITGTMIYFFINGKMRTVIAKGYSGRIYKIGTWWCNHSLKVDLNINGRMDIDFDEGYPKPEIDYETYNLSFSNGFAVQDYEQWTSNWTDETHGCLSSWCSYDPKGVGFLMDIDSSFKCINNVWTQNGNLIDGEELYCRYVERK